MEKQCKKCDRVLDLELFPRHPSAKDGHINICKECKSTYMRKYINKNKAFLNDRRKNETRIKRKEHKERILKYFGGYLRCTGCGIEDKCYSIYDFHHIDPSTKIFEIPTGYRMGWEKVVEELSKCIILCANCHRKEHNKCED